MHLARMTWDKHLATLTRLLDDTGMEAVTKWGKPTYVHAGRNIAMAAGSSTIAAFGFFDGALLSDPLGILENAQEGKTQAMRHWKFTDPDASLPEDDIRAYLAEAMQHAQEGKRVAARPKPKAPHPGAPPCKTPSTPTQHSKKPWTPSPRDGSANTTSTSPRPNEKPPNTLASPRFCSWS